MDCFQNDLRVGAVLEVALSFPCSLFGHMLVFGWLLFSVVMELEHKGLNPKGPQVLLQRERESRPQVGLVFSVSTKCG